MAEITNYTPGEYAKEHIRITPTTLADGRDFFYLCLLYTSDAADEHNT